MFILTIIFLFTGLYFYFYGIHISKKYRNELNTIIQNSKKSIYAYKTSIIYRVAGLFWIIFSIIQNLLENTELSLIVFFVSFSIFYACLINTQRKVFGNKITGKIIFLLLFSICMLIPIGISFPETKINTDHNNIIISGIYNEKISIDKIGNIFLADTLPSIGYRTNGISTGRIQKGYFYSNSLNKNVKLLLNSSSTPYLYIIDSNKRYVIVNFRTKEKTVDIYNKLNKLKNEK